jgi:hypothetical protein
MWMTIMIQTITQMMTVMVMMMTLPSHMMLSASSNGSDDNNDKGTNAIDEPAQHLPGLSAGVDPPEATDKDNEEDENDDKADEDDSDDDGDDDASEKASDVNDDESENGSVDNNYDSPDSDKECKNTGVEEIHPGEITGVGAPDLQEKINHEMDQQYGSRAPELNLHHWKCRDYSW